MLNKNSLKLAALGTSFVTAAIIIFVLWPFSAKFIKIVEREGNAQEASSIRLKKEEELKELVLSSQDLREEVSLLPYRLLDKEKSLDLIRLFESIGQKSKNEIEIVPMDCGEEKTGLCFSLVITGGLQELIDFTQRLNTIPFAHNLLKLETRYQIKENIYQSTLFIRVYTTFNLG